MPHKGYKQPIEFRKKMGILRKKLGFKPPSHLGLKRSDATKKKISDSKKGTKRPPFSKEWKIKIGNSNRGKTIPKEVKIKMSKVKMGDRNPRWKGGYMSESKMIRQRLEYRLWRESVFARDNWTCQKTGVKGGRLHPHHIKNFAQYPELRFAIDNGITLSEEAHKEFHKEYGAKDNNLEQIKEFIKL